MGRQRIKSLITFAIVFIAVQLVFAWMQGEPIVIPGLIAGTLVATIFYAGITWAIERRRNRRD